MITHEYKVPMESICQQKTLKLHCDTIFVQEADLSYHPRPATLPSSIQRGEGVTVQKVWAENTGLDWRAAFQSAI